MNVNHINLTVTNAQAARNFFEKYFRLQSLEGTADNASFVGLRDRNGFVLILMQDKKDVEIRYPDTFHIGFLKQGKERTNEIYQQLVNDWLDVKPPGYYHTDELYINTPIGITIRVS